MEWSSEALYNKAKLFAQRAHDESVDSSLFGFWMSLALELLARSALAAIHPVLLADPREQDNIHYAFGINPRTPPKSIPAKALFARCSVFISDFTDKMSGHCLIISDRRNSELHSGAAAFEGIDNSKWLPATYEVMQVLLTHIKKDFKDFIGDYSDVATEALKDRRDTIKKEVIEKVAAARKRYEELAPEEKEKVLAESSAQIASWLKGTRLRKECACPACGNKAVIGGETVARSPARIDEESNTITRQVRVLPNKLRCPFCKLLLGSFQELNEAGLGNIFTIAEEEDPIEFFGIEPEEYVDIEDLVKRYGEDFGGYDNE